MLKLNTAQDPAATEGERDTALSLAARILAELNLRHLPETAVAALTTRATAAPPAAGPADRPVSPGRHRWPLDDPGAGRQPARGSAP